MTVGWLLLPAPIRYRPLALDRFNKARAASINTRSFGEASISQWIRAGAVIGMGTDSGTPLNFYREALWREAKVIVDLGMPAARAITALTWVNARMRSPKSTSKTVCRTGSRSGRSGYAQPISIAGESGLAIAKLVE